MLELSKGRVTADSARHTGEGIFFTSRAFGAFRLQANGLVYARDNDEPGQSPSERLEDLADAEDAAPATEGTTVRMATRSDSALQLRELLSR